VSGKHLKAVIPNCHMKTNTPPFARPIVYGVKLEKNIGTGGERPAKALTLIKKAAENHLNAQKDIVPKSPDVVWAFSLLCLIGS
jgi:hypothetical protein